MGQVACEPCTVPKHLHQLCPRDGRVSHGDSWAPSLRSKYTTLSLSNPGSQKQWGHFPIAGTIPVCYLVPLCPSLSPLALLSSKSSSEQEACTPHSGQVRGRMQPFQELSGKSQKMGSLPSLHLSWPPSLLLMSCSPPQQGDLERGP